MRREKGRGMEGEGEGEGVGRQMGQRFVGY